MALAKSIKPEPYKAVGVDFGMQIEYVSSDSTLGCRAASLPLQNVTDCETAICS
jgi:hypothetical protein